MQSNFEFIPFESQSVSQDEMRIRSEDFYKWADQRRSVRDFSPEDVPYEVMKNILMTASTAPSGAHKQPWTFCLISNKELKSRLRGLAEEEEKNRMMGE